MLELGNMGDLPQTRLQPLLNQLVIWEQYPKPPLADRVVTLRVFAKINPGILRLSLPN
jgi:hypothetical protein